MSDALSILHLLSGASPYCRALCGPAILNLTALNSRAVRHHVLAIGGGFSTEAFASVAQRRFLEARPCEIRARIEQHQPDILHCWGCTLSFTPRLPMIVDIGGDSDTFALPCADSTGLWQLPGAATRIVVSSEVSRQKLRMREPRDRSVHRIASAVEPVADAAMMRADARKRLMLREEQCSVLVLPPADAKGAGFTAVWASLLVAQIHKNLRIILPELRPDSSRLRALIAATKFEHLLAAEPSGIDWMRLLHAADVGIQLHTPLCGTSGVDELRHLGRPIVTTCASAIEETDGGPVLPCDQSRPKPAAAALLRAVDHWSSHPPAIPSTTPEFVAQYARLYAEILSEHGKSA